MKDGSKLYFVQPGPSSTTLTQLRRIFKSLNPNVPSNTMSRAGLLKTWPQHVARANLEDKFIQRGMIELLKSRSQECKKLSTFNLTSLEWLWVLFLRTVLIVIYNFCSNQQNFVGFTHDTERSHKTTWRAEMKANFPFWANGKSRQPTLVEIKIRINGNPEHVWIAKISVKIDELLRHRTTQGLRCNKEVLWQAIDVVKHNQ